MKQLNNYMTPKQKATLYHVFFFIMRLSAYGFRTYPLQNIDEHCRAPLPVPTPPTPGLSAFCFLSLPEKVVVEYLPFFVFDLHILDLIFLDYGMNVYHLHSYTSKNIYLDYFVWFFKNLFFFYSILLCKSIKSVI